MTITLHAISDAAAPPPVEHVAEMVAPIWFVIQRANGDWSPAAKVLFVFQHEDQAERQALQLKRQHPAQNFGVAMLCSEVREAPEPFQIVRTTT